MSVSSSRKLGVAVLGACRSVTAALSKVTQQVEVNWVIDKDIAEADKIAASLPGQPDVITPTYTSLALTDPRVDAVLVCAPNTKVNTIRKAIRKEKGVFCISPFFHDVGALLTCHEEAKISGKPFSCYLPRRTDSMTSQLKERLSQMNLGSVESIHMSSSYGPIPSEDVQRLSAGLFHECAVNELSLARCLLKEDPVAVFSGATPSKHGLSRTLGGASIILHYPSGTIATCDVRYNQFPGGYRVEVYGSEGEMTMESSEKGTSITSVTSHGTHTMVDGTSHHHIQMNSMTTAINKFLNAMRVSDKERDSAQRDEVIENLRLSLMATACHKASTTEQVVNLSLDFLQNQDNLVRPAWKERPDTAGADPGF